MKLSFTMQLHRLEGFYWTAHAGGFARAARAFPYPISAPAVYQQVRKLEAELGVRLFQRAAKDRLSLTAAGRALFEFCQPFFIELPSVARALASAEHGGTLRVDAAALEIQHFLPLWLARLRKHRPDIRLQVEEVAVGDARRLLSGETDLLVDYQPELPRGISAQRVGSYYAFVIAPRGQLRADASLAAAARVLRDLPFVGFHAALPQQALQREGLRRLGIGDVVQVLGASSTEALLAFVRAGLGFSLIPWPDQRGPNERQVSALRLRGAGTEFRVVAAYRSKPLADPLVAAALEVLHEPRV
jgi:DNA-binding transcriptional LysR family regulator